MEYFLFSYPNCSQCEEIKNYLAKKKDFEVKEYSLVLKESKLKIREFLAHIKRDSKGAIIIPSLVVQENEKVVNVLNSQRELEDWLKSRV